MYGRYASYALFNTGLIVCASLATYLALLESAAAAYGRESLEIFLACGPVATGYCGDVRAVVATARARGLRANFLDHSAFLDGSFGVSCCGHPGSEVSVAMARFTAVQIGAALGWPVGDDAASVPTSLRGGNWA